MRDIQERYFKDMDDESPRFLSPNAERDYRESIKEYKKHKKDYEKFEKEFMAYYNTLQEGLKRLDKIKQIGRNKTEE